MHKGKYARFFALLGRAQREKLVRYDGHREALLDITGGKYESLQQLTPAELRNAEAALQELVDPVAGAANRMRRKVIAILSAHGMTTGEGKPDMVHINQWCVKYGHGHKALNHYSNAELPRLVSQAEGVMRSDINAVKNHG